LPVGFTEIQNPFTWAGILPFGQGTGYAPGLLALLSCTDHALPKKSMRDTVVVREHYSAMKSTINRGITFRWQQKLSVNSFKRVCPTWLQGMESDKAKDNSKNLFLLCQTFPACQKTIV